jgi:hypothetical protein
MQSGSTDTLRLVAEEDEVEAADFVDAEPFG